jgi:hypothetical protein
LCRRPKPFTEPAVTWRGAADRFRRRCRGTMPPLIWTLMHRIDETSPMDGLPPNAPQRI